MFRRKAPKPTQEALKATHDELLSLKAQVERLMNEHVTPVLADAADRAEHVVANARELTDHQVRDVTTRVRAKPWLAMVIVAAIGYLAGRVMR
ncbi:MULTISPECIES: hypothetical protein [Nguyenibacter]|uniref:Uncharacterized protein n=1 Tax=Nguyenibacter vanlangensis TaxID=1216886 RepID=A0A7Y7ITB4_9PROT|nr:MULTISPECIES: hypothetical protein [Nguyenibacter]NVN09948.1 hypothetical protein [Nguyenibacter vanlangensis]WRH86799.1 hypothetical protein QN315_12355 [Nguyenibacter sp. L1]